MTSLRELQIAFARALTDPPAPHAEALIVAGAIPAGRRLQVYRNNVLLNLCGALEAVFPVVRRLVGAGYFDQAARRYVREVPSTAGDVHAFGETFPEYLSVLPGAADLAYLPDVARLEWARHRVFHAADAHPLGLGSLAAIPAADWPAQRLRLVPASALLGSPYPVLRIWRANQHDSEEPETLHLDEGGAHVLVLRQDGDAALLALTPGEYELLAALAAGQPLEQALDAALARDPDIALDATLRKHLCLGTFAEPYLS